MQLPKPLPFLTSATHCKDLSVWMLQVFAIKFVTFAIEFVLFVIEFVSFAIEFVVFALQFGINKMAPRNQPFLKRLIIYAMESYT